MLSFEFLHGFYKLCFHLLKQLLVFSLNCIYWERRVLVVHKTKFHRAVYINSLFIVRLLLGGRLREGETFHFFNLLLKIEILFA